MNCSAVGVVTRVPCSEHFVASLAAATTRPVRIVAVAGRDGGPAPDGVQVVAVGEEPARAAAVNRGVVALPPETEWVVVADPHVEFAPGAVDALLAAADRHPRAGALGPRLRDVTGGALASAGPLPARRDLRAGRVPLGAPRSTGPVGWVSATCLLLRREAWESVDGFDPRHLGAVDAVDLGERLGRAGWLVVHVPGAETVVAGPPAGLLEPVGDGLRRYRRDRSRMMAW